MITLIGYIASGFLALSLMAKSDLRFRWLNTLGCLSFIIYGSLISAVPVILANVLLFVINLYYLFKIYRYRTVEYFDLIPFSKDNLLIEKFLSFYHKDIQDYFPDYTHQLSDRDICFMVLRDMAIANIFVATVTDEGDAIVRINYTVPRYRDFKVGRYLFDKEKAYLTSRNIKRVLYTTVANKSHEHFLKVTGFERAADGPYRYQKVL